MEFVKALMELELSTIRSFLHLSFEVIWGVIKANTDDGSCVVLLIVL